MRATGISQVLKDGLLASPEQFQQVRQGAQEIWKGIYWLPKDSKDGVQRSLATSRDP